MRQSGARALDAAQKTRADSMHDIRAIRENPDAFDRDLQRRGLAPLSAELIALDEARKSSVSAAQANQERRNALAKEIGGAKKAKELFFLSELLDAQEARHPMALVVGVSGSPELVGARDTHCAREAALARVAPERGGCEGAREEQR